MFTRSTLFTLRRLDETFYKCAKVSYWKESTQRYKANLLLNNVKLLDEILSDKYKTGETTNFILNERGKTRFIQAPCMRDRIIQKILCEEVLIPQLRKYLIYDNYASLKDRGTSFARKRIDVLLRKYIREHGENGYILQIDIKKYFDNIDHNILKKLLRQKLNVSESVMKIIEHVIDTSGPNGKGLNLGSEAPQIFAIFYLSRLDNYIKSVKGIKYYGRYMDDMFVIAEDKKYLKNLLNEIKDQLRDLKLIINEHKTQIVRLSHGFIFMQIKYNIQNGKIVKRPTHNKIVRERRRLKKYSILYETFVMSEQDIYSNYKSWRNALIKDCKNCKRTIKMMDRYYYSLFPKHQKKNKVTREKIIHQAFKELENKYILITNF